ncbi:MAG TPA: hypothetical protein VFA04_05275, partial [Bryobacteraceae bacterium]|nr:hypothetical protein [Bryobacteraceae bacterium]
MVGVISVAAVVGQNTAVVPAGLGGWFDTANRDSVQRAWDIEAATAKVPMEWTGSFNPPNAGTTSAGYQAAVMARVNWDRAMAGVPAAVTLNSSESAEDQQAAFMMMSNQALNHDPPPTWLNYTAAGADAANHSNLCFGFLSDPGCGLIYMQDVGDATVGHRRWVLYPQTLTMGTGDVGGMGSFQMANALWILEPGTYLGPRPPVRDNFVAWPPPGYVPYEAVFPRWSFALGGADFTAATVTMQQNGSEVPVKLDPVAPGYGEDALSWVVNNQNAGAIFTPSAPVADTVYTVTVSNVKVNGGAQSFTYYVAVFDPASTATFNATPNKETLGAADAAGTISLSVSPGDTEWIATSSDPSWLNVMGARSGKGSATVGWTAGANTSTTSRSATITIGSAVVTFVQAGDGNTVADVNAAAGQLGPVAAESIVTAYSSDLATKVDQATTMPLPTNLDGSTVTVTDSAGAARSAGLFFVGNGSISQVNYQIPPGTANGPAEVRFTSGDGQTVTDTVKIETVAPALFTLNNSGLVAGWVIRVSNGKQTREKIFTTLPDGAFGDLPIDLGPSTDKVFLELYGTGLRAAGAVPSTCTASVEVCTPVTVTIGGVVAPVTFVGAAPDAV